MKKFTVLFLLVLGVFVLGQDVPKEEREELIKLYETLSGDSWRNNESWKSDKPVKEWYGVVTENINNEEHVVQINLKDNNLTGSINLNLPYLSILQIQDNYVDKLEITANNLKGLNISNNDIEYLDLKNIPNLQSLVASNNQLKELDLTNLGQLMHLDASSNLIYEIDFSKAPNLEEVKLNKNYLTEIKNKNLYSIKRLELNENEFKTIQFDNNQNLEILSLQGNKLDDLKISNFSNLDFLNVSDNNLTNISLSGTPKLAYLQLSNNKLDNIDLTGLPGLTNLELDRNPLNKDILDLSYNPELVFVYMVDTNVHLLNMKNLNPRINVNISNEVKCIEIDNPSKTPEFWDIKWMEGHEGNFSDSCQKYLGTNDLSSSKNNLRLLSPVNDKLIVVGDSNVKSIVIYNMSGQVVKNLLGQDRNIVNLSQGVYVVKIITTDGDVITQKIVKK